MRKCTVITVLSVLFLILTASVTGEPRHVKDDRERLKEAPIDNRGEGDSCPPRVLYSYKETVVIYNQKNRRMGRGCVKECGSCCELRGKRNWPDLPDIKF